MKTIFSSRSARVLTIVLLVQAAVFYGLAFARPEILPAHRPLALFTIPGNTWAMRETLQLDPDTLEVLKADDILSRVYQNRDTGNYATLFVAYFETQRTGKSPHSPKNCLPGAGWMAVQSGKIAIPVSGEKHPVRVNRYVVSRGQNQSVVLYWYQSEDRVIASEYVAKIYTVADSIRYDRSDTALVRVVVGVQNGDLKAATHTAVSFVKAFFEPLRQYLPA
ncbi:MAG: exosortase C-terminal domain/associated protein EpsI [Bryobacteraceae bacterium]